MLENINGFKVAMVAIVGALTALWGWMGWLIVGWVLLMLLDYITGSIAAAKAGEWSSKVAREGVFHKFGMIVVVMVSAGADLLIGLVLVHLPVVELPIEFAGLVCPLVLVWYCITELGSLGENAVAMGAPMPPFLKKILAVSKDVVDKAGDKLGGEDDEN